MQAAEIPVKFVKTQWGPGVSVSLTKPLGLSLVEGANGGVCIDAIVAEGSASQCSKLKTGMSLVRAGGQDCSSMALGSVLELVEAAGATVDLTFTASAPSAVAVPAPAPPPAAPKAPLEGRSKVDAAFDKNFGSEEGFNKLLTKVQKTVFNPTTWKNPIWGGSLAFAVGFPLLIVVLAGDRL